MSFIEFNVQLKDDAGALRTKILSALLRDLNKSLYNKNSSIRENLSARTQYMLGEALRATDEYISLTQSKGELRSQLGLLDTSKVEGILDMVAGSTTVSFPPFKRVGDYIQGIITVKVSPTSMFHELASEYATYTYRNSKGQEVTIPWFAWLIKGGGGALVEDYETYYQPTYSRTGRYAMRKAASGWAIGGGFLGGTLDDNFITRALDQSIGELGNILNVEIQNHLNGAP